MPQDVVGSGSMIRLEPDWGYSEMLIQGSKQIEHPAAGEYESCFPATGRPLYRKDCRTIRVSIEYENIDVQNEM